jgi:hypothetical protein
MQLINVAILFYQFKYSKSMLLIYKCFSRIGEQVKLGFHLKFDHK